MMVGRAVWRSQAALPTITIAGGTSPALESFLRQSSSGARRGVPSDPFSAIVGLLIAVINAIGVITVVIAVALGLHPYVASFLRFRSPPTVAEVRAQLGRGLVLSLEIFLAADLLR